MTITPYKVLCIENDATSAQVMQAIFSLFPMITLLQAENAKAGILMAVEESPSLILMDIGLPDMDGYQVLHRLKSLPETQNIPMWAVSAFAFDSDVRQGLAAGFDQYITKPIRLLEFKALIEDWTKAMN